MSSSSDTSLHDARRSGASPLLFVFLVPMLAVIGFILWIGASPTWLLGGVALGAIAVMTGVVMVAINRLLADGDSHADERHAG